MFLIYNLFSLLSLIVYLPWLLFKKGPEDRLTYLSERLGISKYAYADIWVHAVSVGEVIAALLFLKALKKEFPEIKIVLSTTTYTGQRIAREKFAEANRIMYMPWDTGLCINRAIKSLRPKIFITIETELWPLLFKMLKKTGSNIIILNGRLSPESFRRYKRIRSFMRRVLSHVDFLYMQGKGDSERIISLGAEPGKVRVMGNFKFDVNLHDAEGSAEWLNILEGKVLVAGSTHRGEEEIILDAYVTVKKAVNNLKLVLAPRHPERFNEVEEILKKRELNFIRRSALSVHSSQFTVDGQQPDVILLDTMGELFRIYAKAEIALIGGSLLPFGGHNILEPASWGKPVVFGPYMDNFPIASDFLSEGAALVVKDSEDIAIAIKDLLRNTEKAKQMGRKAKTIIDSNTGAVEKALDLVRSILGTA